MLVHRRVTPSIMSPVPICTPGWRETKRSKVPCLRKQRDGRGLNPGPPDPEFKVLTARPHTPLLRAYYLWFNWSGWIFQIKSKTLVMTAGMVWPVSYDKFKATLVSFYWECCIYYLLFLGIRRENSTSFYLSQSHNLTFGLFISVLNRYFWCPTFSGNTLVHSRGWWRLRSAFVFNRQERIHRGEELCWQGKYSDIKRQHRDPRIKLPFPAQCRVSAFETDIDTLLSIFYKQLVGNSLSVNIV